MRLFVFGLCADASLDIGVGWVEGDIAETIPHTRFEIAPRGTDIKVGDEVRIVTADFARDGAREIIASHHRVLDGIVSNVDDASNLLTLSTTIVPHNGGAAVLNSDMHLIGMVVGLYGTSRTGGRAVAVHVDAIRSKLCVWTFLSGSDCD